MPSYQCQVEARLVDSVRAIVLDGRTVDGILKQTHNRVAAADKYKPHARRSTELSDGLERV